MIKPPTRTRGDLKAKSRSPPGTASGGKLSDQPAASPVNHDMSPTALSGRQDRQDDANRLRASSPLHLAQSPAVPEIPSPEFEDEPSLLRPGYSEVLVSLLSGHPVIRRNLTMMAAVDVRGEPKAATKPPPPPAVEEPPKAARVTKKPLDAKKARLAAKRKAIGGFGAALNRKKPPVVEEPAKSFTPTSPEKSQSSIEAPEEKAEVTESIKELPVEPAVPSLANEVLPLVEIVPQRNGLQRKLINPGRLYDNKLILESEKDVMLQELSKLQKNELDFMLTDTPPIAMPPSPERSRGLTRTTPSDVSACSIFPNDFDDSEEGANNFPLWVDGVDKTFAPFLPTPLSRVRDALKLAQVRKGDGLIDLGCGDGRFCILALKEFGANFARGYDSDGAAIERALTAARVCEEKAASFEVKDFDDEAFLSQIVEDASVTVLVTVLTSDFQKKHSSFIQKFVSRDGGRRVVSVFFNLDDIPGVVRSASDDKSYVYSRAVQAQTSGAGRAI